MVRVIALMAAAFVIGSATFAAGPGQKGKKPAKVTEVHICPQTGESVKGEPAGSETVGKYKVFFCCAGCKGEFAGLSKDEKEKKVAEIVKKAPPAKKG